jgi:hypothetical protein
MASMPKQKRSKPKRNLKPGPKEERLIIDIDPEEAMMRLLKKPPKTTPSQTNQSPPLRSVISMNSPAQRSRNI